MNKRIQSNFNSFLTIFQVNHQKVKVNAPYGKINSTEKTPKFKQEILLKQILKKQIN